MPTTSPDNISYPNNTSPKKTIEGHLLDTATSVQTAITDIRGDVDTLLAGKANSSHVHSAADITSGSLAVARGGSGVDVGTGLVPIVPSSVSVGSGSATVSATGTVTFTGATSISLNTVFSSAYRHYRIIIDTPTTSGTGNLTVRFRSGTTDDAVNTYFQYWTMKRLTGAVQDNSGGPSTSYSLYGFLVSGGSSTNSWSGDVIFPNVATTQTWITGQGFGYDATSTYMVNSSILYNSAKAFDGITFFSAAQLTGTVKVLGYR
jgi:hypothetical protein